MEASTWCSRVKSWLELVYYGVVLPKVAQQSLSQKFLVFPAELFERVFKDLLPRLQPNWQLRIIM
ncbi:hypothetical protein CK516_05240 [Nostoc sp. 'Peltigera malacea cyanobiont' DB3992]|nr:hypothetical protein CK516_05240 [Nostoc sp. 'Peltigera malacea cyanobiont' DB3992]